MDNWKIVLICILAIFVGLPILMVLVRNFAKHWAMGRMDAVKEFNWKEIKDKEVDKDG